MCDFPQRHPLSSLCHILSQHCMRPSGAEVKVNRDWEANPSLPRGVPIPSQGRQKTVGGRVAGWDGGGGTVDRGWPGGRGRGGSGLTLCPVTVLSHRGQKGREHPRKDLIKNLRRYVSSLIQGIYRGFWNGGSGSVPVCGTATDLASMLIPRYPTECLKC